MQYVTGELPWYAWFTQPRQGHPEPHRTPVYTRAQGGACSSGGGNRPARGPRGHAPLGSRTRRGTPLVTQASSRKPPLKRFLRLHAVPNAVGSLAALGERITRLIRAAALHRPCSSELGTAQPTTAAQQRGSVTAAASRHLLVMRQRSVALVCEWQAWGTRCRPLRQPGVPAPHGCQSRKGNTPRSCTCEQLL